MGDADTTATATQQSWPSYFTTLLTTPSPKVSLLIAISDSPRLLATYKVLKWILHVILWRGTEIFRILQKDVTSKQGTMKLTEDGEGTSDVEEDEVRLLHRAETRKAQGEGSDHDDDLVGNQLGVDTLWRIDYAIEHSRYLASSRDALQAQQEADDSLENISNQVVSAKSVQSILLRDTLSTALRQINEVHVEKAKLLQRSEEQYEQDNPQHQDMLREVWRLFKPEVKLETLSTKQWQDIGFQGKDPATDWRATGLLGLDSLLSFAKSRQKDQYAQRVVREAVDGGAGWYPFAIATISITSFSLDMLRANYLMYFFLSRPYSSVSDTFFSITSTLIEHFHHHWRYLQTSKNIVELRNPRPTVMEFESVFKSWRLEVLRWVSRGKVAGHCDSRGLYELFLVDATTSQIFESKDAEGSHTTEQAVSASTKSPAPLIEV